MLYLCRRYANLGTASRERRRSGQCSSAICSPSAIRLGVERGPIRWQHVVNGLRERTAKSLVWTALESGGLAGLSFITLIVFSRLLTPADFGLAAMALSIVQILTVPVELLFHDALIRSKDASRIQFDTAFTVSVVLGAVLCAACWAGAVLVARAIEQPALAAVLRWMSLSLVATGFGSAIIAHQRRIMAFRPLAIRSLIGRTGAAAIGIALAVLGAGVWSLVAQQVLMVTLATAFLWLAGEERPRFRFSLPVLRELGGFGARSVLFMLVGFLVPRLFILIVGRFLGSQTAGYFNLAFRCVDMLRSLAGNAVLQLALPIFSQRREDPVALSRAFNSAVEFTCAISYPVFATLMVVSPDITEAIFGIKWLIAAPLISTLSAISFFYFARQFVPPIMVAVGRPLYPLVTYGAAFAFVVAGMLIVGYRSMDNAVWVWVAASIGPLPIEAWLLRRATGIGIGAQWRGVPRVAIAAALMIASMALFHAYALPNFALFGRLSLTIIIGGAVYLGGLVTLNRTLVIRLIAFARFASA
jgi:O-antigen/teichoic acid export membrane protein